MPYASLNGCRFYYELKGRGPDMVFVHSEYHGIEYWEYQIAKFSKRYRCLTYCRRAHGLTETTERGYELENQTKDLAKLIEHLKINRPVVIAVGFGTTIAANYAIRNPEEVKALVLVAWAEIEGPSNYRGIVENWVARNPRIAQILKSEGKRGLTRYINEKDVKFIPVMPHNPRIRRKFIKMFVNREAEGYAKAVEFATSVPNMLSQFKQLKIPILAVGGGKDPYPDHPNLVKGMTNFREVMIPDAERFVQWDRPDRFNEILGGFLRTSSGSP